MRQWLNDDDDNFHPIPPPHASFSEEMGALA
jgi:hypothetical protein